MEQGDERSSTPREEAWTKNLPTDHKPESLTLVLYLDKHVRSELKALKKIPVYNEVLEHGSKETGSGGSAKEVQTGSTSEKSAEATPSTSGSILTSASMDTCPPTKKSRIAASKESKVLKPGEVDPTHVLHPSNLPPEPINIMEAAVTPSQHILGKLPTDLPEYTNTTLPMQSHMFLGCSTTRQYLRLVEYLTINGDYKAVQVQCRGPCQYASFRRGIDCPKQFTNTHLRRHLLMEVINHREFFFPILQDRIAMIYGGIRLTEAEYKQKCADGTITEKEKQAYNQPGPFSIVTYLEYILDSSSWGDEITLVLLSMVFQVRITVIDTASLKSTQVRHDNLLEQADLVLLLSGGNHYMAAVHQVDDGDNVITDTLDVNPLEEYTGYELELDDPEIYSDDEDFVEGVELRDEWEDRPIPKKKDIPQISADRALLVKKTLEAHHFNARLLESFGVNACKQYKLSKAQTILDCVGKGDSTCKICGKEGFSSTHTLRSHIRSIHIKVTQHQCDICQRYFAEKSGLKAHRHLHVEAEKFACDQCDKSYGSKGHLNEHKKAHLTAEERGTICAKCGKEFAHKKGYVSHKEWCGVPEDERHRFKCDMCEKDYAHKRDLTTHKKVHEKNE